jgi:alpha-tubulin suppressor-like RCC1 family protein
MTFTSADMGSLYACGLTNGAAFCWGSNTVGELGSGVTSSSSTPIAVAGGLAFRALDANSRNNRLAHTCGVTQLDQAYCWGSNRRMQLGAAGGSSCTWIAETFNCSLIPIAVGSGIAFEVVAVGNEHTCGLGRDRALYCWGSNGAGQLGDGTTTDQGAPVRVKNP